MTDDWQYLGEEPEVECVAFRCKTHTGAIRILRVPEGWTWAIDCHRLTGDVLGYSEPLGSPWWPHPGRPAGVVA